MKAIWSYAGLAAAIVVAALLIVPGFLDWSRYADLIEREVEAFTGRDAEIAGDVRIALLPRPRLTVGEISLSNLPQAAPADMFRAASLDAELSVAALLRGRLEVSRLVLKAPQLVLEETADGRRNWEFQAPSRDAGDAAALVGIGEIAVEGATVIVRNVGPVAHVQVDGIGAEIDAGGLRGPYRAKGSFVLGDTPAAFSFSIGAVTPDKSYPATASVTFDGGAIELDGIIAGGEADLRFDGAASGTAHPDLSPVLRAVTAGQPLRVAAGVVAGPQGIGLRDIELAAGTATLTGTVSAKRTDRLRLEVDLALTLADLSRLEDAGVALSADGLAAAGEAVLADLPDGAYDITIDTVRLPGGEIRDVKLSAEADRQSLIVSSASAQLPGATWVRTNGAAALGAEGPYFSGDVSVRGTNGSALAAWLAGGAVPIWLRQQPLEDLHGGGNVFLTPQRVSVDSLDIAVGEDGSAGRMQGRAAARFGTRPHIAVDLDVEALALPPIGELLAAAAVDGGRVDLGVDGTVSLRAGAIDAGTVHLEDVFLTARADGPEFTVREFLFHSAAGASATLMGETQAGSGRFQATLTAPNVSALEGIVALPPGALDTLAPLSASAQLAWPQPPPDQGGGPRDEAVGVSFLGRAGPVEVEVNGTATPGQNGLGDAAFDLAARASARSWSDLVHVARAVAVPRDAAAVAGPGGDRDVEVGEPPADPAEGTISLAARGVAGETVAMALTAALGPLTASAAGSSAWGGERVQHAYEVSVDMAQSAPLLAQGLPVPAVERARLEGSGTYDGTALVIDEASISAGDGDARLALALSGRVDRSGERPRLQLAVDTEAMDLRLAGILAAFALDSDARRYSPPRSEGGETGWSSQPLALDWLSAAEAEIALAGDGIGAHGWHLDKATGSLRLADGTLALESGRGLLFGGEARLSGALSASRGAVVQLDLAARGLSLAQVSDAMPFGEIGTGSVDLDLSLAGRGMSESALVSSLTGKGTLAIRDGTLAGLDLAALSQGLEGLQELDDFAPLADAALWTGATPFQRIDGTFEVTAGVVRAPALEIESESASGRIAAFVDPGRRAVDVEAAFDLRSPPEAPDVKVIFAGPVGSTQRRVNDLALEAFAAQRILERDIDALVDGGGSVELRQLLGLPEVGPAETGTP